MRKDFERGVEPAHDVVSSSQAIAKRPVITLDVSLFEEYLADSSLTDDQKREFLEVLWSIIVGFVDLGFGIHPVQQALPEGACEKIAENGGTDGAHLLPFQQQEREKGAQPCREEER